MLKSTWIKSVKGCRCGTTLDPELGVKALLVDCSAKVHGDQEKLCFFQELLGFFQPHSLVSIVLIKSRFLIILMINLHSHQRDYSLINLILLFFLINVSFLKQWVENRAPTGSMNWTINSGRTVIGRCLSYVLPWEFFSCSYRFSLLSVI